MGKIELALNLAKRTANYLKVSGKSSILATKPQALKGLQLEGLKLAAPLRSDVCVFPKDPSLAPELLDDLLKCKGSQLEKVVQIKDRFLRAMGYNPELVRCDNLVPCSDLSADFMDGVISCTTKQEIPIEKLVAAVRHELDHLDKFAKVVKAEGVDAAESAVNKAVLKYFSSIQKTFDRDFWLKFSKDADIKNFESKKYLEAIENYPYDVISGVRRVVSPYDIFDAQHMYCTNELEKSAYAYTKKVLRHYGVDDTTRADFYGEPFGKIKNLLETYCEKRDIYEPKGFLGKQTFDQLYSFATAKTSPLGVEHLKYIRDIRNKIISPNQEKLQQVIPDVNDIEQSCTKDNKRYLKVFDTVYDWLKQEKFTINDIDLT